MRDERATRACTRRERDQLPDEIVIGFDGEIVPAVALVVPSPLLVVEVVPDDVAVVAFVDDAVAVDAA